MYNKKLVTVTVLMSSYNGEQFIEEQIESILNQEGVNVNLVIRDDGSSDSTKIILNNYNKLNNVTVLFSENIGVVGSFLYLIDNAPDSEYYSLADQDDIWHPDKLKKAVEMLSNCNNETPLLYGANQNCVDKLKKFLNLHFEEDITYTLNIEHVLFRNLIAGCTMVFNKKLLDILKEEKESRNIAFNRMHDTWIMLVALIRGKVIYDHRSCMEYRRHGNNVTNGAIFEKKDKIKEYQIKIKNFLCNKNNKKIVSNTAMILLNCYRNILLEKDKENIKILASYRNNILSKIKFLFNNKLLKISPDDKFVTYAKIIFNKY